MTKKERKKYTPEQKLEYAKLMVDEGYSNEQVQQISGASMSAVSRWKRQYKDELGGVTPKATGLTEEQREIQSLKKQLARAKQDNEILKKAAAFFIRENHELS